MSRVRIRDDEAVTKACRGAVRDDRRRCREAGIALLYTHAFIHPTLIHAVCCSSTQGNATKLIYKLGTLFPCTASNNVMLVIHGERQNTQALYKLHYKLSLVFRNKST